MGKLKTGGAVQSPSGKFEHSLKRLEEIVETLEQGSIPLDDVMTMYQEGVQLSKQCLDHLRQAELKLKTLSKDLNGDFELIDTRLDG
jgi:exodeoxyribonuclease VII small subunit